VNHKGHEGARRSQDMDVFCHAERSEASLPPSRVFASIGIPFGELRAGSRSARNDNIGRLRIYELRSRPGAASFVNLSDLGG